MAYPENYPTIKQGVRLVAEGEGHTAVQLTAVVDRVEDDGKMELGCLDAKKAATLRPKLSITLEYFREGVVYKMQSVIEEVGPEPDPENFKARRQILVTPPREIKKIQRRRFPRARVWVTVGFFRIDPPTGLDIGSRKGRRMLSKWAQELENKPGEEAYTETLSGSGLRMRVQTPVAKGDTLFLRVELPNGNVDVVGEVVWLGTQPPQEVPGEAVGVDFAGITDETRQALLEFVGGQKTGS